MSSLDLLEAKIIPKLRTMGNYCHGCYFCGCGGGLVVGGGVLGVGGGSICGDWGVLALVMDFREVMLTSPPELAHCAPPPYFRQSKVEEEKKLLKLISETADHISM